MSISLPTRSPGPHDTVVDRVHDPEKVDTGEILAEDGPFSSPGSTATILKYLSASSVELRGVLPVPLEERTSTRYSTYFSIWFCMNANLLAITFGMLGPTYGLGLRDSVLVIIFFCSATAVIPAYLGTLGPKTGLRQMIQARFSFGRYIVSVPVILNLATLTGFCVITCVVGGQCLSSVSDGSLTSAVGIVIIGVLSLFITFYGYNVLHNYERFAWIPALIAISITVGYGGSHLNQQVPAPVATPRGVLSFGMSIASYMIPFSTLASDFTTYLNPRFPSWRLFLYGFAGLTLLTIPLMVLGAAIGGATPNVPAWQQGYEANAVGGVLAAMLLPAGGFGKFVVVVLSLTLLGNNAATMYSITLNFQILIPQLVRIPRYIFSIVITAILIPVSIKAATDFFVSLQNFISLIAYWSAAFVAVLIVEHVYFRGGHYDTYHHDAWNLASRLPWGVAALTASAMSFALIIPSIDQVWFTGPIAEKTGDIGFELAFVTTAILYLPLRALEKKISIVSPLSRPFHIFLHQLTTGFKFSSSSNIPQARKERSITNHANIKPPSRAFMDEVARDMPVMISQHHKTLRSSDSNNSVQKRDSTECDSKTATPLSHASASTLPTLSKHREPVVRDSSPMSHGYSFVPKGNPYLTRNCRQRTQQEGQLVYAVVNDAKKQVGIRVPSSIYREVLRAESATRTSRQQMVKKRDEGIEARFKEAILAQFPRIPPHDVGMIIRCATAKGKGRVGRTGKLEIASKARLATQAHAPAKSTQSTKDMAPSKAVTTPKAAGKTTEQPTQAKHTNAVIKAPDRPQLTTVSPGNSAEANNATPMPTPTAAKARFPRGGRRARQRKAQRKQQLPDEEANKRRVLAEELIGNDNMIPDGQVRDKVEVIRIESAVAETGHSKRSKSKASKKKSTRGDT
ncbi:hypothetical protein NUW58_g1335 [Xylaria curta]|uniref:Uncharacterized protein n=1 Tax=Xylaria curta TaxID=42375 RepID=A0ACC1PLU4_9PEZI|nr:hypothetical protein NUW58_g1335 [Xylaria curta]